MSLLSELNANAKPFVSNTKTKTKTKIPEHEKIIGNWFKGGDIWEPGLYSKVFYHELKPDTYNPTVEIDYSKFQSIMKKIE